MTPEELEERRKGIGGADAGVVAGVSPFKGRLELFLEKRGEAPPPEEETEAQEWGKFLEDPIALKYMRVTGRIFRRQPAKVSAKYSWMRCNIDRQIMKDQRGPGILEVKSLNAFTRIDGVSDLPDYIYLQGQHNLAVWGYDWMAFAILIGGQHFVQFDMDRDQATIEILIEIEREFWRRVELGDPPSPDGSDATRALMKHLYPKDSGTIITLNSTDALATVAAYQSAKAEMEAAEDRKQAAEHWLKFRMGDAAIAKIAGWGEATWKSARTSKHEVADLARLKADFPDAYKSCVTIEEKGGGRRFMVKQAKGLVPR